MSQWLRIVVVDDEAPARARLRSLLEEGGWGDVVGEAGDGVAALEQLQHTPADVVLLDIRMPRMSGLELARHLCGMPAAPAVVFTTAYDEHALAAFDAGAIDYLLKPVRGERLAGALMRARRLLPSEIPSVLSLARTHLSGTLHGELRLLPVAEVCALRAEHKYVTAYGAHSSLVIEESLTSLEEEFAGQFLRVHRAALVRADKVTALHRGEGATLTVDVVGVEEPIHVSRRMAAKVRRVLRHL